ncbi:hypothetical protein HK102_005904 [Quaeritorhiza haematococci]|nr:hypothetical protein HK102_005904 [Quaeritorhiza haematococci]
MRFSNFLVALFAAASYAGTPVSGAPLGLSTRAAGQNSLTVTARQDMFDEAIKVVVPIAKAMAPTISIPDQSISGDALGGLGIPIAIGNGELATAKNIKIESLDVARLEIPLDQGKLRFQVTDAALQVGTDIAVLGSAVGRIAISVTASIGGSVFIKNNGAGGLVTDIQDVSATINRFDFDLSTLAVPNEAKEFVNKLISEQLRQLITGVVSQPIDNALTQVLNEVLKTPPEIKSDVQGLAFGFRGEFLGEPQISADGLTATVAVIGSVSA